MRSCYRNDDIEASDVARTARGGQKDPNTERALQGPDTVLRWIDCLTG